MRRRAKLGGGYTCTKGVRLPDEQREELCEAKSQEAVSRRTQSVRAHEPQRGKVDARKRERLGKLPLDKITSVIPLYWWGFFFEPCRMGETCSIEIAKRIGNVYNLVNLWGYYICLRHFGVWGITPDIKLAKYCKLIVIGISQRKGNVTRFFTFSTVQNKEQNKR